MDGAQYSRSSSFRLLSFSIFNREYTLSPASKLKTPGSNCGAQFCFTDLLQEKVEIEVCQL